MNEYIILEEQRKKLYTNLIDCSLEKFLKNYPGICIQWTYWKEDHMQFMVTEYDSIQGPDNTNVYYDSTALWAIEKCIHAIGIDNYLGKVNNARTAISDISKKELTSEDL